MELSYASTPNKRAGVHIGILIQLVHKKNASVRPSLLSCVEAENIEFMERL